MNVLGDVELVWSESATSEANSHWIGVIDGSQSEFLVGSWHFVSPLSDLSLGSSRLSIRKSLFLRTQSAAVVRGAP